MKTGLFVLYYVIAATLVLKIHQYSPTNMAGLGFDIVVYPIAFVTSIGILAKNVFKSDGTTRWLRVLNIVGSLILLLLTLYTVSK